MRVARRLGRGLAAGCVAMLAAGGAAADGPGDGGTRSVFAYGAGNRALALGAAFCGVADDASASLWNPGGLGAVSQPELQFSQALHHEAGFRETFAGLVYPRWRWGVAALTVRHFGDGGIELRDDRNLPLSGSAAYRESEVAVAYSHSIGEAWSAGGMAKLRRQELAGRSGGGVGADLGVMLRPALALRPELAWARDLSIGVAVSNVLRPSIRLDRESVADPATTRVGAAFRHRLFAAGRMLATVDLETTRGMDRRLHAGVELSPLAMFALRAGLNSGLFTAGTGIRWGSAALDYVVEDGPLGAVHRAGLSLRIGRTVAEEREAYRHAEEKMLQARLAEIDRRRQAERIAQLLAKADAARGRRAYDEALEVLATLRALDGESPRAKELEAAILTEKGRGLEAAGDFAAAAVAFGRALAAAPADTVVAAALERCRAASDLRAARSAAIRGQFAAALEAFTADDLTTARTGFESILAMSPADTGARSMLRRAQSAISQRVEGLLKQADLLVEAGLPGEAAVLIQRARSLDPHARGLAEADAALARKRQALADEKAVAAERAPAAGKARRQTAAAHEEPLAAAPAPPLSPQQAREIADLYRRGIASAEQGRSDEAMRYWELVWSLRPGYERVGQYLKREYQTRGMESFAAGKLNQAVSLWEKALSVDATDPRTLGYLARAHEQIARAREISGQAP